LAHSTPASEINTDQRTARALRRDLATTAAEQFGTLESLYQGRIDLGLGRAPGSPVIIISQPRDRSTQRMQSILVPHII
jgi:alkanesulfonate monooxygenase SsuD/methylene tetrahydromethanopterin reductase-like flavin-dependent oxidoreductase (luciferase family)